MSNYQHGYLHAANNKDPEYNHLVGTEFYEEYISGYNAALIHYSDRRLDLENKGNTTFKLTVASDRVAIKIRAGASQEEVTTMIRRLQKVAVKFIRMNLGKTFRGKAGDDGIVMYNDSKSEHYVYFWNDLDKETFVSLESEELLPELKTYLEGRADQELLLSVAKEIGQKKLLEIINDTKQWVGDFMNEYYESQKGEK